MEIYFAPMEGITGYIYRNAFHDYFTGVDKYFTPFLSPNQNRALNPKEIRDVLPENNKGMQVVPQILTNRADYFLRAAEELKEKYGYGEVNLNLGCPSRTVVSKGKGAGFLAKPEELDSFFREVFHNIKGQMSVKARIGVDDSKQFCHLMDIFNQYPLCELIIHPRIQKDYYGNSPDWEVFGEAVHMSGIPLCYNGDIFTLEDYRRMKAAFPEVNRIMLGRGLLMNPMLAEAIKKEEAGTGKAEETGTRKAEEAGTGRAEEAGTGRAEEAGTGRAEEAGTRRAEEAGTGKADAAGRGKEYESGKADGPQIEKMAGEAAVMDKKRLKGFHDRLYNDYKVVMSREKNVLFKMKEFWVYAGNLFPGEEKQLKKIKKASRAGEYESAVEAILA